MKTTFIFLLVAIAAIPALSQKQLEFLNQRFELLAERNGQPVRLETRNFGLRIN